MSSTVVEHAHEHEHELEPHIRIGRARAAVIMFIISDLLSIFGIMAAGGYLSALNTENQFRVSGDHAPTLLPGVLVAIALVLRSEEHTSELQSQSNLVCRLLLEKKKK